METEIFLWLVLLTLGWLGLFCSNPMLWFALIRLRARLRMPRMRRELRAMGRDPDARFKPRIVVKRMKDGKEVL
jgi:hypothetical protein